MKVYAVLRRCVNYEGWSVGSDHLEKIFSTEEKAESYVKVEKNKPIPEHWNKSEYTIMEYEVD